ncbi:peptidase domain-containing ABC transporter [Yasminevirus sp. GU-2018]|uniref:Peptidase domain-containing ABC transporter n=1 Tax=Yasminevirus sp. GU-2018 TaxID=2420051 RepID=A0A5K0U986_9VIRU|nr:peptidase domain-containing ABC transporter [Yasminevirus sp. GU-2018]
MHSQTHKRTPNLKVEQAKNFCRARLGQALGLCMALIQCPVFFIVDKFRTKKRKVDIEQGETLLSETEISTKQQPPDSNWTFWHVYIAHGLNGSVWNIFYLDPVATVLVIIEILANTLNTYSMTIVTQMLTSMSNINTNEHATTKVPPPAPMQGPSLITTYETPVTFFVILLMCVMFTTDVTRGFKRALRHKSLFYKNRIIRSIENVIVSHIKKASPETLKEYSIDDRNEALNRFVWVYDNVTDTLIDTAVQTARSVTFCSYLVYKEPRLIPILAVIYAVMWKYVIPHTSKKRGGDSGEVFWQRAYYDIATDDAICANPLYNTLYTDEMIGRSTLDDTTQIDVKKLASIEQSVSADGKVVRPNVVERYMETIRYYSLKHLEWSDSHDTMQTVQNVMAFLIIVFLVHIGLYGTALIVLINRGSLFGVLATYSDMKRCEKNAEKSMEKIVVILDAIDQQIESAKKEDVLHQVIDPLCSHLARDHISSIKIEGLNIVIPAQKVLKKEESSDEDLAESDEKRQPAFNYDRHIVLDTAKLDIVPNKCLLLDGHTGCGKSVTINALAGLYSKKLCRRMTIGLKSGQSVDAEFNQILGSRCYVSQMLSEDYKYNGKIALPLYKLFPGVKSIEEITHFLSSVFALKPASIPESLSDTPHSKLSGGEIQRYVVASQVWRALKIRPDIMILDEVDRALDKETAVKVISWIVTNVNCFFVIVSHLTEVKQMLFEKQCVQQVWTYDDTTDKYQISIRTHLV